MNFCGTRILERKNIDDEKNYKITSPNKNRVNDLIDGKETEKKKPIQSERKREGDINKFLQNSNTGKKKLIVKKEKKTSPNENGE